MTLQIYLTVKCQRYIIQTDQKQLLDDNLTPGGVEKCSLPLCVKRGGLKS